MRIQDHPSFKLIVGIVEDLENKLHIATKESEENLEKFRKSEARNKLFVNILKKLAASLDSTPEILDYILGELIDSDQLITEGDIENLAEILAEDLMITRKKAEPGCGK